MMKLQALGSFAASYGDAFHRIEALAEADGRMKVIDMKASATRKVLAVREQSPEYIYRSDIAVDYNPETFT
jgi:type III restriction enzyme